MKLFITGTDTAVGKTTISVKLLNAFKEKGFSTLGMKPVASGCSLRKGAFENADVCALKKASTIQLDDQYISPFMFRPAIAPHIAAKQINCSLTLAELNLKSQFALSYKADVTIVEGFGGWYAPLNDHETMADFALHHELNIILVVGLRVGCINHALLTANAFPKNAKVLGWIADQMDPTLAYASEIILSLKKRLSFAYLGTVGYRSSSLDEIDLGKIFNILSDL